MPNEKDPFKGDTTSFLKTAIVGAPLAAGAGIGIRNMIREGVSQPKDSSVSRAMATLNRMQGSRPWELAVQDHLNFIRGEANYIRGAGARTAQEAWVRAMAAADPMARQQMLSFAGNIQALPPEQVFSAIENTMTRQKSEMAESIYRRFSRNITALRESEAITGGFMPYEAAAGKFGGVQFRPLPPTMQQAVARIEAALGIDPGATRPGWYTRPGWKEEGLGTYRLTFPTAKGDVTMMVPLAEEGILVSGTTQQTRYIAPEVRVWDVEKKAMEGFKRHEFLMAEFEREIVPEIKAGRMDKWQAQRAVTALEQRVIHQLESVVNVPTHLRTGAQMAYEDSRRTAVDIMIREEGIIRRATEDELADIARREGLYGGVGPKAMAKGRLQTADLARFYMTPEAAETAKRLEQGIRKYELTAQARAAMEAPGMERYARYRQYESAAMRAFEPELRRPSVRTLYVEPEVLQKLRVGEGEVLARRGLRNIFEFQANQAQRLVSMRQDLKAALLEGKEVTPAIGEIIGWTEAQEPFRMQKGMRLLKAVEHRNRSLGEFFSLHYMDIQRLESHDKFFEDMKMLMRLQGDSSFKRVVGTAARSRTMADNVEVIASLDFLKKDPRKLQQQIVSGMGEVLARREMVPPGPLQIYRETMGGAERISGIWGELAKQVRDPKTGKIIPDMYSPTRFVREAMRFGIHEAALRPSEFREVFGAVPYALGGTTDTTRMLREVAKGLSEDVVAGYVKVFEAPGAVAAGIAKIAYAEPARITGAGAMGSVEARVFDVLRGPTWGPLGEEISEDLMRRLEYTSPERLAVHREVGETLKSMAGGAKRPTGARAWKAAAGYTYEGFEQFIERGGGWITPGKGMRDIYVPGAPTLKAMREFQVGEITVRGRLVDTYHDVARAAARMHEDVGRITPREYERALEEAAQPLVRQWAPGGKGMGRVTGGKLIGTRFLRGVSEIGGWATARKVADPFVAGLPTHMFDEMFNEMTRSKLWAQNALRLERMREQFMAGEEIGGMVLRHPLIGEFSAQPMRFQRIETPGTPKAEWVHRAEIALPEEQVAISIKGSPGPKRITIGPLVGLAGDKDADIYSAMLLEPNAEKQARQMTMRADSAFTHRYTQHQVRYQLLKAQAAEAGQITVTGRRIADIRKLGTTQRWIGQLSTQLSSARRALVAEGGAGAANALTLLEWLEQTPISAKHISALEMEKGGMEGMLTQITSALKTRGDTGERRLKTVIQNIVKDDVVAGQLLTGNVTLERAGAQELTQVMGRKIGRTIEGIDINTTIKHLMSSMDKYEASGGSRWADLMMGRGGRVKLSEIGRMVSESSASITRGAKGVFSTVSTAVNASSNIAGSVGRSMIRNYKPLALGLVGAMAIGAALSSPPETIGPGSRLRSMRMNMNVGKAKGRMGPERIHPPEQERGRPRAPDMLRSPRTMIAPPTPSRQTVVRARANYMVNSSSLAGQLAGAAGGPSTNVNIRDNRSSLNPHVIANRLV